MPKDAVHDHYDEVKVKEMRGEKAVEIMKIDTVVWKKGKGFSYEIRAVEMKDGKAQRGEEDSFEQLPINEDLFKCIMSATKAGLNNHIHFVAAPEAAEMEVEEQGGGGGGAPAGGPQLRLRIIAPAEPPAAAAAASPVAPAAAAVASPAAPAAP